jgi:hypothetical protein
VANFFRGVNAYPDFVVRHVTLFALIFVYTDRRTTDFAPLFSVYLRVSSVHLRVTAFRYALRTKASMANVFNSALGTKEDTLTYSWSLLPSGLRSEQ